MEALPKPVLCRSTELPNTLSWSAALGLQSISKRGAWFTIGCMQQLCRQFCLLDK